MTSKINRKTLQGESGHQTDCPYPAQVPGEGPLSRRSATSPPNASREHLNSQPNLNCERHPSAYGAYQARNEAVNQQNGRRTGRIKWFNQARAYGFIERENGEEDVYIHMAQQADRSAGPPSEGEEVEYFLMKRRYRRSPEATRWIKNHAPQALHAPQASF